MIAFTFLVPILIAVVIGWRGGARALDGVSELLIALAWAMAWCTAVVFLWQALWIASLSGAGMAILMQDAGFGTLVSAAFWLPALVITYILRAMRVRRL
ncbi:hypothetical protein [Algirhabdus cladophorae]|uniref:hypothetical protein n=1 Tax=Algirhabdus cladophorae TaxID=3377108 RepID=UPI003B847632